MARNYSNIALDTTLVAGIAAGDLSLVVASASGWPTVPFAAVLDPGLVTEEVVQVTIKAGTTFTITRGFDGTTAAAHALGATVRHAAIAGDFTDLQAADTAEASARSSADSALSSAISSEATTRGNADSALSTAISAEASTRAAADALLTPMARTLTINGVPFDLSANRSWTVSGGVSSVTASAPLASSGGATPDISLTGTVPSANGGTGVNNAGTLTNATNTTITGGGTLALAGFTLTIPATGTAALLGASNLFTVRQDIRASGSGVTAGLYVPWITGDALATMIVGATTAGNNQNAIQGQSNSAAGGLFTSSSGIAVSATSTSSLGLFAVSTSGTPAEIRRTSGSGSTNDVILTLNQRPPAAGAAGSGATLQFKLKSSTTPDLDAANWATIVVVATHASRTNRVIGSVNDFNGAREWIRGEADGTNPMIGFLGANATARVAITGSRAGNAALASLLTELASKGLITDSSSA